MKFAAADEAARSCRWKYAVVTGWRRHVWPVLDALSAQRRPLDDPLQLRAEVLDEVARGPFPFGDLVRRTSLPVVARAQTLHLLWHRQLGIDMASPLSDGSMVWLAGGATR